MKKITLLSNLILAFCFASAQIIHVPEDYPSIQQGIDAANYGDTVLVSDGTYYENINFLGKKPLMVASEFLMDGDTSHITNTIIDGSQSDDPDMGTVVTFESGEDTTSVLCGFTITGGSGTFIPPANAKSGGGVFITSSGAKLLNNYIEFNEIAYTENAIGGGVNAGGPVQPLPWVVLRGNRINHNKAISSNNQGMSGGIANSYNLIMIDNQISYNEAKGGFRGDGGGGRISGSFGEIEIDVRNNLITHNKAVSNSELTDIVIGGGLDIFNNLSGIVSNNRFLFNEIEVATEKWGYGAGVMIEEISADDFMFENNVISDNTFSGGYCTGGGICIWDSKGNFLNNVIQSNKGTSGGGVRIGLNSEKMVVLMNNNITGNEASYGGGFYLYDANAVVVNTIIWGNIATVNATIHSDASTLEVRYSDVEGDEEWPGEGNINIDPEFQSDGYHLDYTSMMLNKGQTTVLINGEYYDCPMYDIDGDERPFEWTNPDIGADEAPWLYVSVEESISSNINLYPNPANQLVTISNENGQVIQEVTIYNQTGQKVYRGIPDNNTLDISKLQPGIYVVEVATKEGNMRKKLVVQ